MASVLTVEVPHLVDVLLFIDGARARYPLALHPPAHPEQPTTPTRGHGTIRMLWFIQRKRLGWKLLASITLNSEQQARACMLGFFIFSKNFWLYRK